MPRFCTLLVVIFLTSSPTDANDRLAQFNPLIGSWKFDQGGIVIESTFRWVLDQSFIEHEHHSRMGEKSYRVKELIGWDPVSKSIKSWMFTSNGVAIGSYEADQSGWKISATLDRSDGSSSVKKKQLQVEGDSLVVTNEAAPIPQLVQLRFQRIPDAKSVDGE